MCSLGLDKVYWDSGGCDVKGLHRLHTARCCHFLLQYIKPKQTAVINFMQCEMLIIDVSCFI